MAHRKGNVVLGLLQAAHFGPTMLVSTVAFLLSLSQFSYGEAAEITVAIFSGQLVVGWSNDLIDYSLDRAAVRTHKPLVTGKISTTLLKRSIPVAFIAATTFSLIGPLGVKGTVIHLLGIGSATLYNLKLKSTVLSFAPHVISFGALPWAIFTAAGKQPPIWLYLAFILFSTSFHFLNVLKDLEWDLSQGVLGLPQRIGKRWSIRIAVLLIATGVLDIFIGLSILTPTAAHANAIAPVLPNSQTTPGALNPLVTQANIGSTICTLGYTKKIRPPVSYTNRLKIVQLSSLPYSGYGSTNPKLFEEDHLISLELGGNATSPKNLWPEPWGGSYGARKKDTLENTLHTLVCAHLITLKAAQVEIATDWFAAYNKYVTEKSHG